MRGHRKFLKGQNNMRLYSYKIFQTSCLALGVIGLSACGGKEQSQSGALPAITSAPYAAPGNLAAKKAYMVGFKQRYDIPVLEYPPEIKARAKAARLEKLKKNKKLLKLNMAVVKKTLTSEYVGKLTGHKKSMADELLGHMDKKDLDTLFDATKRNDQMWDLMATMAIADKKHGPQKPALTAHDYDKAVKAYDRRVKAFRIEKCRWTEMQKLIGSGYEKMAKIYGERPSHGYRCVTEAHITQNSRYDRPYDGTGFFIKSSAGEWQYFGKYTGVGVRPRRLELNAKIMKNPEKAIKRLPFWDLDI